MFFISSILMQKLATKFGQQDALVVIPKKAVYKAQYNKELWKTNDNSELFQYLIYF